MAQTHAHPGTRRSRTRSSSRSSVVVAATAVVFLVCAGACSGEASRSAAAPVDGDWIDGPPLSDSADATRRDAPVGEDYAADGASPATGVVEDDPTATSEPSEVDPEVGAAPRAGNIDDNADFDGFLEYLGRVESIGVPFRELDPTGRVVITVEQDDGAAVSGAQVVVASGGREVARLRTTADGTARLHPLAYGVERDDLSVSVGAASADVSGPAVTLTVQAPNRPTRIPLDIAFAIDTTGSMSDELEQLKNSIASVVERIEGLPGEPDVRLAMTAYRDEGDAYVTATHDFTGDIGSFGEALATLEANGGGDTPEALDEAVGEALTAPAWSDPAEATQLLFVVGDAGGHPERNVARPYTESMKLAAERGVKIFPIAASSTDDQAEVAFRQMAQFTGARFVFLAYGAGGAAVGGSTDIAATDYEELSLDDLIVRLVSEELAARTGTEVPVPSTTSTTMPPGQ